MGIFLKRTTRKKVRPRKSSRSRTSPRPWDGRRALKWGRVLLAVTVVAVAVFGWHRAEGALGDYVTDQFRAPVAVESVALLSVPPWMSLELQAQLQGIVADSFGADPLASGDLRAAVRALASCPWVAQVHQIRRASGGRIRVEAEYRRPVALVQFREGYYLIDAAAVRLPGVYAQSQIEQIRLPVLIGVDTPAPAAGRPWSASDLDSGLALVLLLESEPYMEQIYAIDMGQYDDRGRVRLVLLTQAGGMVRWGLPPGREQSVEPSAEVKKQRLAELYRRRRLIDDNGKVVEIYGAGIFIYQMTPAAGDRVGQIG